LEIDFSDREKAARDADFFNALLNNEILQLQLEVRWTQKSR